MRAGLGMYRYLKFEHLEILRSPHATRAGMHPSDRP